jgi:hypothetical protein
MDYSTFLEEIKKMPLKPGEALLVGYISEKTAL